MKKLLALTMAVLMLLPLLSGCVNQEGDAGTTALNSKPTTLPATTSAPISDNTVVLSTEKQEYQAGESVTFNCQFPGKKYTLTVYHPNGSSQDFTGGEQGLSMTFLAPGLYSAYITADGVQSNTVIFVVKADQQTTNQPTTAPTTQPTTAPTTTAPTSKPTSALTSKPTTNPTTKPNPCAEGHTYEDGFCIYCLAADPYYNPCADGHTYRNGYCVYCLDVDPNYDPCAKGHTYSRGICIYCDAPDPDYDDLKDEYGATLKILIPGHNPKDANAWQNKVVAQFKQRYPDVTVQFVTATWNDWYEKVLAAYLSGNPIDLINDGVNNEPKFALMGITQPLQNYINMDNPNLKLTAMRECFAYGGNYYVAASEVNYGVIYYNKDMFRKAGLKDPMDLYAEGQWTWMQFMDYAKALTNKETDTFGFSTEFPYLFFGSNATSTLKVDKNGRYTLNMDDPAFAAALGMVQDGAYKNGWSGFEGTAMGTFQSGKAAMLGSFTMYETEINSLAALFGWEPLDYGVVPLPAGPNNPEGLNMVHSSGWAIGAGSDCPYHVGKLIDMLVDGHAAYQAEQNRKLPSSSVALYEKMAEKVFCVNTRDSAIGGGYDLLQAVAGGTPIARAIEDFKPKYQAKIDELS